MKCLSSLCVVYLDDIIIHLNTLKEHGQHFRYWQESSIFPWLLLELISWFCERFMSWKIFTCGFLASFKVQISLKVNSLHLCRLTVPSNLVGTNILWDSLEVLMHPGCVQVCSVFFRYSEHLMLMTKAKTEAKNRGVGNIFAKTQDWNRVCGPISVLLLDITLEKIQCMLYRLQIDLIIENRAQEAMPQCIVLRSPPFR